MKIYSTLTLLMCLCVTVLVRAQYDEMRYRHAVFSQVTVQNDVKYGSAPQWVWPYWNVDLNMDVYQPDGDVVSNRPLIIFAHAGGFLNGSKGVDNMIAICDSFARKGYVTASLDYRKGFNPLDGESAERAVYRGIQDGKAAVRYFKENAALYGIDTNYIYFGGMSAGGFMALHVAYMDEESERPASTYGGGTVNNLGCLDCSGNNFAHTSKVRAVLNYWGAIQDTLNIVAGDVPVMQMHGTDDPTVPFEYGQPFGLFTLPYVFGSKPVRERMENLGVYNEFYTSSAPGRHMLDGSDNGTFTTPPVPFWYDTLLPRTTDFLVLMTKPNPEKISADTVLLCHNEIAAFMVDGGADSYYKWMWHRPGDSGLIENYTNALSFVFANEGSYDISVVEFNEVYCSSDTLWFHVIQQPEITPDFNYQITDYTEVAFTNNSSNGNVYFWDFGDGATSNDVDPVHTYMQNGTYTVSLTVENEGGCSETVVQTVVINHLSVDVLSEMNSVVFPNPFENEINIQNGNSEAVSIEVVDMGGKRVFESRMIEASSTYLIHTEYWNKGIYFVNVYSENGSVNVVKIVK